MRILKFYGMQKNIGKQLGQSSNIVNKRLQFGFNLTELMITVAIVGALASIAYPSYTGYVSKSNRSEGQGELLRFANLQEQYFVDYRTYGKHLKKLGKSSKTIITEHGHYMIEVTSFNDSGFVLSAIAQGTQATNDSSCTPLTINQVGSKGPAGCWD